MTSRILTRRALERINRDLRILNLLRPGLDAAVSPALGTVIPLGSRVRVEGKPSKAKDSLWVITDRCPQPGAVLDLSMPKGAKKFMELAALEMEP